MKSVLKEAEKIVVGTRRLDYGTPRQNHGCTAELWTSFFKRRGVLKEDAVLIPEDVCFANILQKISRSANKITRDNLVDISGYAENVEIIQNDKPRKHKKRVYGLGTAR